MKGVNFLMKNERRVPLVSVVVPNYNYARYLPQRIESILHQSFQDFELILLDDASTDGSLSVLQRYATDSRVSRLEVNTTNTGSPFRQWVKGIRLARGKYVWIAEADDLADPSFLETCVKHALAHDDFSFAYAGSLLIDADGKVNRKKDVNKWGDRPRHGEAACFDGRAFAGHNLYWKNYVPNASGALFRREYALRVDSGFADMRYCGDWLFWFSMAMQGKVVEVYRLLNYFRQHAGKVTVASARSGGGILEDIRIVELMERDLPPLGNYKKRLRRGRLYEKAKRLPLTGEQRKAIYGSLKGNLGGSVNDYFIARLNQVLRIFLPTLPTSKRDRL